MTPHILLIEDDDAIRCVLSRTLEHVGYRVTQACHGREGLRFLEHSKFDLVVTDIVMPEMEGIEVLMEIRKRGFAANVLAMSGGGAMGPDNNLHLATLLGAQKTLTKPFTGPEFLAAVNEMIAASPQQAAS